MEWLIDKAGQTYESSKGSQQSQDKKYFSLKDKGMQKQNLESIILST